MKPGHTRFPLYFQNFACDKKSLGNLEVDEDDDEDDDGNREGAPPLLFCDITRAAKATKWLELNTSEICGKEEALEVMSADDKRARTS